MPVAAMWEDELYRPPQHKTGQRRAEPLMVMPRKTIHIREIVAGTAVAGEVSGAITKVSSSFSRQVQQWGLCSIRKNTMLRQKTQSQRRKPPWDDVEEPPRTPGKAEGSEEDIPPSEAERRAISKPRTDDRFTRPMEEPGRTPGKAEGE